MFVCVTAALCVCFVGQLPDQGWLGGELWFVCVGPSLLPSPSRQCGFLSINGISPTNTKTKEGKAKHSPVSVCVWCVGPGGGLHSPPSPSPATLRAASLHCTAATARDPAATQIPPAPTSRLRMHGPSCVENRWLHKAAGYCTRRRHGLRPGRPSPSPATLGSTLTSCCKRGQRVR